MYEPTCINYKKQTLFCACGPKHRKHMFFRTFLSAGSLWDRRENGRHQRGRELSLRRSELRNRRIWQVSDALITIHFFFKKKNCQICWSSTRKKPAATGTKTAAWIIPHTQPMLHIFTDPGANLFVGIVPLVESQLPSGCTFRLTRSQHSDSATDAHLVIHDAVVSRRTSKVVSTVVWATGEPSLEEINVSCGLTQTRTSLARSTRSQARVTLGPWRRTHISSGSHSICCGTENVATCNIFEGPKETD